MAQPSIRELHRTDSITAPYWDFVSDGSTANNHDPGIRSDSGTPNPEVRAYVVDAAAGSPRFTYAEFFAEIATLNEVSVAVTTSSNTGEPSRTFSVTANSNMLDKQSVIIFIRTGTLFHETGSSTRVTLGQDIHIPIIGAPGQPNNGSSLVTTPINEVGVTYGHSNLGGSGVVGNNDDRDTTAFTGRHEITTGTVVWQFAPLMGGIGGYPNQNNNVGGTSDAAIQPVEGGDPRKVPSQDGVSPAARRRASGVQASLAHFCPAAGQSCLITDFRLRIDVKTTDDSTRWDFDICGQGVIDAAFEVIRTNSSGNAWTHTTADNPNNNIRIRTYENLVASDGTNTVTLQRALTAGIELFSSQPLSEDHPYLTDTASSSNQNLRFNAPITVDHLDQTNDGGQYNMNFTGSGFFNSQANRAGICLQAVRSSRMGYWQSQWDTSNTEDMIWLDPPFELSATNTPINIAETTSGTRGKQIYLVRSVAVNNRDSSGNPKGSYARTFGRQASATTLEHDGSWLQSRVPQIRAHNSTPANSGTWSVRPVDQTGAGLEGVVGRGGHYLVDGALQALQQGNSASHYTRYTSYTSGNSTAGANESYLLHRGGLHRYSQNVVLRTAPWNFSSNGCNNLTSNNDVDDCAALTDNHVAIFKNGLLGMVNGAVSSIANGAEGTVVLDGFTNLTETECNGFIGAYLANPANLANNRLRIDGCTRVSATEARFTVNNVSGAAISLNDNAGRTIIHGDYTWQMLTSGTNAGNLSFSTINASGNKELLYSSFAAMIQAKLELIVERKQNQMGTENATFGQDQDLTYFSSTAISCNELMRQLGNNTASDCSYVTSNSTQARTCNINRVQFAVNGTATWILVSDPVTDRLNYVATTTPVSSARVTHGGAFTDATNGARSYFRLVLPSGVSADDLEVGVAFVGGTQNVAADSGWRVAPSAARPSITTAAGESFIIVPEAPFYDTTSTGATVINKASTPGTWYMSITGPGIRDFRAEYLRAQSRTINLVADDLDPGTVTAPTKIGNILIGVGQLTGTLRSDTGESYAPIVTNNETWINTANIRLAVDLDVATGGSNGYDEQESHPRIRRDFADAKNSMIYADYVARFGADPGGRTVLVDRIDLNETHWRIYVRRCSRAQHLLFEGAVPENGGYEVHNNSYAVTGVGTITQDGFFGVPAFSLPAVETVVQQISDTQETNLNSRISDAALGIP